MQPERILYELPGKGWGFLDHLPDGARGRYFADNGTTVDINSRQHAALIAKLVPVADTISDQIGLTAKPVVARRPIRRAELGLFNG